MSSEALIPIPSKPAVFFLHFTLPVLCVDTKSDTLPGPLELPFSYSEGPDLISVPSAYLQKDVQILPLYRGLFCHSSVSKGVIIIKQWAFILLNSASGRLGGPPGFTWQITD